MLQNILICNRIILFSLFIEFIWSCLSQKDKHDFFHLNFEFRKNVLILIMR